MKEYGGITNDPFKYQAYTQTKFSEDSFYQVVGASLIRGGSNNVSQL